MAADTIRFIVTVAIVVYKGLIPVVGRMLTKMQYNGEDPQLSEFFVILIVLVVIGIAAWLFS